MSKVYTNVILFAIATALGISGVFGLVRAMGAAPIILPLGVGLTIVLLQIALLFGKRQKSFTGWLAPWSMNASTLFVAAWVVLGAALWLGGIPFRLAIINGIDPVSIANAMILGLLSPVVAAVGTLIMAFASSEREDGPEVAE